MRADRRLKPLPPEPATLLSEGRVDDAVRALRQSQGLGSRAARAWIEAHIADDPMLRVQLETQRRSPVKTIVLWVLAIDLIVTAAIIYYFVYLRR